MRPLALETERHTMYESALCSEFRNADNKCTFYAFVCMQGAEEWSALDVQCTIPDTDMAPVLRKKGKVIASLVSDPVSRDYICSMICTLYNGGMS